MLIRVVTSWIALSACVSCEPAARPAPQVGAGGAPAPGSVTAENQLGAAAPLPPPKPTGSHAGASHLSGPTPFLKSLAFSPSTSLGSPQAGSLKDAAELPAQGPGFRHHPGKRASRRYGTKELVSAVILAAAAVERELPGSELYIGDIGAERGGRISGHASHQSGRDVDVYFYLLDSEGKPRSGHPIPLDPSGHGTDYKDLSVPEDDVPVQLDVPRTWAWIEALMSNSHAHVQRIFVAEHIRTTLLEQAARVDASALSVQRFSDVTCQPNAAHDDHFHIRFFCAAKDVPAGCLDRPPLYPWHAEHLAAQDVEPVMAPPVIRPRSKRRTQAQIRAQAGPMHSSVEEFLNRRESWSAKPETGRKWCW